VGFVVRAVCRRRSCGGGRLRWLAAAAACSLAVSAPALADVAAPPPEGTVVDWVAARFYALETGGAARPRFVTERVLAFEARLEALREQEVSSPDAYQERHVRAALETHVAEELLSLLLIEREPSSQELTMAMGSMRGALVARVGGADSLRAVEAAEGIEESEVEAIVRRQARAAIYVDRAVEPILHPSEEELRELFRTSAHPFRDRPFERAQSDLTGWLVAERLRQAAVTFLQAARTRVKIIALAPPRAASRRPQAK
jgi:hypothetical protein